MKELEINWKLNSYCEYGCEYCHGKWSKGSLDRTLDQYLDVVEKLQATRYPYGDRIKWTLGGGEPLHFPNLNQLLQKIKEKNSYVRLDTSGGDSWFGVMEIIEYIDYLKLTHHSWQNTSVLDFIIDLCKEKGKKIRVVIPLLPGKILEGRVKVLEIREKGVGSEEQVLKGVHGETWSGYSSKDKNLINNLPEDYVAPPYVAPPYVPLNEPPPDDSPSYTGKLCYAGIDILRIDHKGFAKGSECGGRPMGNVFESTWEAPAGPFACPMLWCRIPKDRDTIRVNQS
jgi:MoaA/NifB/PqqE/SkfB family radical SAM enzyme